MYQPFRRRAAGRASRRSPPAASSRPGRRPRRCSRRRRSSSREQVRLRAGGVAERHRVAARRRLDPRLRVADVPADGRRADVPAVRALLADDLERDQRRRAVDRACCGRRTRIAAQATASADAAPASCRLPRSSATVTASEPPPRSEQAPRRARRARTPSCRRRVRVAPDAASARAGADGTGAAARSRAARRAGVGGACRAGVARRAAGGARAACVITVRCRQP